MASSKFLQNVGLVSATKRNNSNGDPTRIRELEAEKQSTLEVRAQLDVLEKKVEELEEARAKGLEKIMICKKE